MKVCGAAMPARKKKKGGLPKGNAHWTACREIALSDNGMPP